MNCFAHALPFFETPYYAIGTCVPDWLTACDRKCRVRSKRASAWVEDENPIVQALAEGVIRHHEDDRWFHSSTAFTQLNMRFAVEFREQFGNDRSMRPSLIGHVIIEMFLDAFLESKFPGSMDRMYQLTAKVDGSEIQTGINHFANRPTKKLIREIERFNSEKYLLSYLTDEGIRYRMNKVLERLKLKAMPVASVSWLAEKRRQVFEQARALLSSHPLIDSL